MSPPDGPSDPHAAEKERRRWNRKQEVLRRLFSYELSAQTAAEQLAAETKLPLQGDPGRPPYDDETDITTNWGVILEAAREDNSHHDQLNELLVHLSRLPQPLFEDGQGMTYYGRRIWEDLPLYGIDVNEEINCFDPPSFDSPERITAVQGFVNANALFALNATTDVRALQAGRLQGLWVMRGALEHNFEWPPGKHQDFHAFLPAAAAWVCNAGRAMFTWEFEYEHGPLVGDPGDGGPLWSGEHGFCRERWSLWKRRFEEFHRMEELPDELRNMAKCAAEQMEQIEAGS
jgi:hypothetical protein